MLQQTFSLFLACEWLVAVMRVCTADARSFVPDCRLSDPFAPPLSVLCTCIRGPTKNPRPIDGFTVLGLSLGSTFWTFVISIFWQYLLKANIFTALSDSDHLYHSKTVLCLPIVRAILRGWRHCGNFGSVAQLPFCRLLYVTVCASQLDIKWYYPHFIWFRQQT